MNKSHFFIFLALAISVGMKSLNASSSFNPDVFLSEFRDLKTWIMDQDKDLEYLVENLPADVGYLFKTNSRYSEVRVCLLIRAKYVMDCTYYPERGILAVLSSGKSETAQEVFNFFELEQIDLIRLFDQITRSEIFYLPSQRADVGAMPQSSTIYYAERYMNKAKVHIQRNKGDTIPVNEVFDLVSSISGH